ncbi:lytic transglycosylase domain-containing protein [Novosphingobium sp. PS1R-30]|uniref:Lytic transglycosylase domain-containing protein n=1 Tax=Novosphingobium anseongense TaxID=3133436 RepID=A0ABU8S2E5_9SPHN
MAALLVAVPDASPAFAGDVERWRASIEVASRRFGVPVAWIESVMRAESAGKTMLGGRPIVSSAGAMGLMQLMPATWRDVRAKLGLGRDPHEPHDNILAGTYYLRLMHDQYGYPGLFAAYNAGPGRYEQYLRGGRRLPAETRAYVAAVAGGRTVGPVEVARARAVGEREGISRRAPSYEPARQSVDRIFFAPSGFSTAPLSGSVADGVVDAAVRRGGSSGLFAIGGEPGDR